MSAPYVRTPAELADLRTWMLGQWSDTGTYATASLPSLVHRLHSGVRAVPGLYVGWERQSLRGATLWWVAPEMVDVLDATAAAIPDDVRLADLTRPSHSGLVVFGRPLTGIDSDDPSRSITVDALVWGSTVFAAPGLPGRPGLAGDVGLGLSWYRRLDFGEGLGERDLLLAVSLGLVAHGRERELWRGRTAVVDRFGTFLADVGDLPATGIDLVGTTWAPLGRSDWPSTDDLGRAPWEMPEHGRASYVEDRRRIAALWLLLGHRAIAATSIAPGDRPAQRRAERAGVPRETARFPVRIVTLRKVDRPEPAGDGAGPKRRPADHRWIVRAHPCWQPCGPGRSQRRLILRGPYVAGPADAPLRTPEVVHAWRR